MGLVPLPHVQDLLRDRAAARRRPEPKREVLAGGLGLLDLVAEVDHPVEHVVALRPLPAQRVEGPGLDQALDGLAVEDLGVVLEEEVERRLEAAGPLAGRDELLDGRLRRCP